MDSGKLHIPLHLYPLLIPVQLPFFPEMNKNMPLPHGEGTMNYVNDDVYNGQFYKGQRSGNGICKYANGDVWDGTWNNDEWDNCVGVLTYADGTVDRFDGNN